MMELTKDWIKEFKITSLECTTPDWEEQKKVHNWKNYISEDIIRVWDTFTDIQKFYIFQNAEGLADQECWE